MTDTWVPARRRGRPPASDSARTRERILQAAQKAFAESGYEAATFQAIAVDIGLTRPAINNYFDNKASLYGEVARRVSSIVRDAVRISCQAPTLAEQILTFIRLALRNDDSDPSMAAFLVQAAMDVGHLPGGDSDAAVLVERFVRASVSSAVRRGEIEDEADGLSDMLMGLVWGAAFQIGRGNSERADRMLDQLCGVLHQGLVRSHRLRETIAAREDLRGAVRRTG